MGFGTEATRSMISYAFETFSLHKIFARAVTHNPGSWRVMEKVGMTHEGILKQHEVRWGKYLDITYYGVLRKDFQRRRKGKIKSSNIGKQDDWAYDHTYTP